MMIKGLSLFQTSAIVATKHLDSGVCIKVYNWEACKLGKSVSCNFSDSKEGVCNENGWLSRILKATGDRSRTHPTLEEVKHTVSQPALALESSSAPCNHVKTKATSVPGHFQGKHRDFLLSAPNEASRGVVVKYGVGELVGRPGSPARGRVVLALGAEPASLLVFPLETHAWLSSPI